MTGLNYVQVTGTWADSSGLPVSGTVTFTPSQTIYASGLPLVTPGVPVMAQVSAGVLRSASGGEVQLLATDNAGLSIQGGSSMWFWTATVAITSGVSTEKDSWDFSLPYSAQPVDLYATKNLVPASWPNPMTAPGDMIAGGALGSAERIPGNSTTAREFLVSQGTGSAAQVPSFGALQAGDVPSLPYAPLASPVFTGTPTAPTASPLTDDTQVATTAYADSAVAVEVSRAGAAEALKAPLASPVLTGTPTAPTASPGTNTTQLATTAFVETAVGGAGAVASVFSRTGAVTAQSGDYSSFYDASGAAATAQSNAETYAAAQASAAQSAAEAASDPAGSASTAQSNAETFATSAVATETTRAEAAEALLAPLASPAFSGTPTSPTPAGNDNSTAVATTAFVRSASKALIAQMTVTATQAGVTSNGMSMTLRVLTGASGAAGATGANATFGSPQQVALTPQASGSVVYGALYGFSATPTTANAATQFFQQQTGPGNYAQFRSAGLTTASTPVTVGLSSANGGIGICAAEIKGTTSTSLAEDPSTPVPTAYSNTVTTMTTAAFAPPPGSVLCLTVTAVGSKGVGSGVTTMAITDTSGLGLTWTEVVKENGSDAGYTGVWLAQVPTVSTAAYPVIPEVDDRTSAIIRNFSVASLGVVGLMAAIANRDNANCSIAVIGDSITEGMGATAFTSRYVYQANKALRQRYPTLAGGSSGGLGLIPWSSSGETTYTWPIVNTSGQGPGTADDIGPVRRAYVFTGASVWTFTAPAGTTSVKVMYYNDNSGSQFSYQVNSGTVTTVAASGTVQDGTLTSSITMTGADVLTVRWVSGTVYLEGIVHWAGDESSGITLHGCGHFGITTAGWIAAQASSIDWRTSIAALAPNALAINLETNDSSASITAPASAANLQTLITYLRGNATLASLPVLLMIPGALGNGTQRQAWTRAVAANLTQVQVVDLAYRTPSQTLAGYLYYDAVHPNNAGHAFIGEILAAAIGIV